MGKASLSRLFLIFCKNPFAFLANFSDFYHENGVFLQISSERNHFPHIFLRINRFKMMSVVRQIVFRPIKRILFQTFDFKLVILPSASVLGYCNTSVISVSACHNVNAGMCAVFRDGNFRFSLTKRVIRVERAELLLRNAVNIEHGTIHGQRVRSVHGRRLYLALLEGHHLRQAVRSTHLGACGLKHLLKEIFPALQFKFRPDSRTNPEIIPLRTKKRRIFIAVFIQKANYFDGCNKPFDLIQGAVKSYGDEFINSKSTGATIVTDRTQAVSNNCKPDGKTNYSKFDTDSTLFYYDAEQRVSDVMVMLKADDVPRFVLKYAGAGVRNQLVIDDYN